MSTSAADRLATELYNELVLVKTGPSKVIQGMADDWYDGKRWNTNYRIDQPFYHGAIGKNGAYHKEYMPDEAFDERDKVDAGKGHSTAAERADAPQE